MLMYDDLRHLASPRTALLDFLQSAFDAGAKKAGSEPEMTPTPAGD